MPGSGILAAACDPGGNGRRSQRSHSSHRTRSGTSLPLRGSGGTIVSRTRPASPHSLDGNPDGPRRRRKAAGDRERRGCSRNAPAAFSGRSERLRRRHCQSRSLRRRIFMGVLRWDPRGPAHGLSGAILSSQHGVQSPVRRSRRREHGGTCRPRARDFRFCNGRAGGICRCSAIRHGRSCRRWPRHPPGRCDFARQGWDRPAGLVWVAAGQRARNAKYPASA